MRSALNYQIILRQCRRHIQRMSPFGPKRTFRRRRQKSTFEGKADIDQPPTNPDLWVDAPGRTDATLYFPNIDDPYRQPAATARVDAALRLARGRRRGRCGRNRL